MFKCMTPVSFWGTCTNNIMLFLFVYLSLSTDNSSTTYYLHAAHWSEFTITYCTVVPFCFCSTSQHGMKAIGMDGRENSWREKCHDVFLSEVFCAFLLWTHLLTSASHTTIYHRENSRNAFCWCLFTDSDTCRRNLNDSFNTYLVSPKHNERRSHPLACNQSLTKRRVEYIRIWANCIK